MDGSILSREVAKPQIFLAKLEAECQANRVNHQNFRMTSRRWAFTLFLEDDRIPDLWNPDAMKYLIFQLERAETTGRLHLQGSVALKGPSRKAGVKKLLRSDTVHVEPARNWQKSVAYSKKEETRVQGPWEFGEDSVQGQRSDLAQAAQDVVHGKRIRQIALDQPATFAKYFKGLHALKMAVEPPKAQIRKCALLWGSSGTGKTRTAYDLFPPEEIYKVFDVTAPWFDGYEGQRIAILDDCGAGMMNIQKLKNYTDRYPTIVPIKGGSASWNAEIVILTSNHPLEHWYEKATYHDVDALRRRMRVFNYDVPEEKHAAYEYLQDGDQRSEDDMRPPAPFNVDTETDDELLLVARDPGLFVQA